jgi:hypothetical protein
MVQGFERTGSRNSLTVVGNVANQDSLQGAASLPSGGINHYTCADVRNNCVECAIL